MKLDKITRISIAVGIWAIVALLGTVFYSWLETVGFIQDFPDVRGELPWNGRKIIFAVLSLFSFVLLIARIIIVADE